MPLRMPHAFALRHARATVLLTAGVHPKVVSERLGSVEDLPHQRRRFEATETLAWTAHLR